MARWEPPFWVGDRLFTAEDLALIQWTACRFPDLSRWELALTLCENLPWRAANGQPKAHACLPLLEQLAAAGLLRLPAKKVHKAKPSRPRLRAAPLPDLRLHAELRRVRPVTVEPVAPAEQTIWDATMAAYHPLGFQRAFGAHQRYWIRAQLGGQACTLGAFLFAAAAKALAVRDTWIGWTPQQRQRFRHRILANSRFLLLPGVAVPHLASHALALATRRLPSDWIGRYGFQPLLAEAFVTPPWTGTCYRAANWLHLGQTAGRGRQDRHHAKLQPVRHILVYPLARDWRRQLLIPDLSPPMLATADAEPDA